MFKEIKKCPNEVNERKIKYLGTNPTFVANEIKTDEPVKNPVIKTRKKRKRKKVLGSDSRRVREANARKREQELTEEEEKEKRKREEQRISVRVSREAIERQENAAKSQQRHKDLMRRFSIDTPWETATFDEFELG